MPHKSSPYDKTDRKRKTAKPHPQRTIQDEQLDTPERDAHQKPVRPSHHYGGRQCAALRDVENEPREHPDSNDAGKQSQFSFKPWIYSTLVRRLSQLNPRMNG